MNINLDNYETFFLLYVDNELSAGERKAVEEFVDKHEELREEFLQLQDTVLPVEDISYPVKKDLYKAQVIESALQENLLLHLDGELNDEGLEEMKGLLTTNYAIKNEWEILQKTKLDPADTIIFPDKSSLYRRPAGVLYARITKLAIAAAIIGMGIFIGLRLQRTTQVVPGKEQATINNKKPSEPKKAIINENKNANNESVANNITDPLQGPDKKSASAVESRKNTSTKNRMPGNKEMIAKQEAKSEKDPLVLPNPEVKFEKLVSTQPNNEIASLQVKEKIPASEPVIDKNIITAENNLAMTAAYDNSENSNDNRILYMKEENITRSKAAAFFRKVKRVVERNTKIKAGDNLRIGGFEIAIK